MIYKVLNLYAGIGGNRKLWDDVKVTAVEWVPEIAQIYRDFFPNDEVIETDAHQFLLENFQDYDFIWSSPPCPTHSRARYWAAKGGKQSNVKPIYPSMNLYQEIIFLENYFDGLYCIENVVGYYEPLIKPQKIGRHYFWANFFINKIKTKYYNVNRDIQMDYLETIGLDISKYSGIDKKTIRRNCVNPLIGKSVLDSARSITQQNLLTVGGNL